MSPLLVILLVWTGIAVLVIVTGMSLALYHSCRRPRRYVTLTVIADDPSAGIEEDLERKAA